MESNLTNVLVIVLGILVLALVNLVLWRRVRENGRLKYEFVTVITHKFRTPLTEAKWVLADLVSSEKDPYRRESLARLQKSNDSLIKLITALVALGEAASDEKALYRYERIDLCAFVRDRVERMRRDFAEKNVFIAVACPTKPIAVRADRSRLEFIVDVVLENARMYTPTGRRVSVAVAGSLFRARIAVADEGIGIAPADMPHVFDGFFRSNAAVSMDTEGLGIGLSLARSMAERQGGSIKAASNGLGTGTTFTIRLPRKR